MGKAISCAPGWNANVPARAAAHMYAGLFAAACLGVAAIWVVRRRRKRAYQEAAQGSAKEGGAAPSHSRCARACVCMCVYVSSTNAGVCVCACARVCADVMTVAAPREEERTRMTWPDAARTCCAHSSGVPASPRHGPCRSLHLSRGTCDPARTHAHRLHAAPHAFTRARPRCCRAAPHMPHAVHCHAGEMGSCAAESTEGPTARYLALIGGWRLEHGRHAHLMPYLPRRCPWAC